MSNSLKSLLKSAYLAISSPLLYFLGIRIPTPQSVKRATFGTPQRLTCFSKKFFFFPPNKTLLMGHSSHYVGNVNE